VRDVRGSDPPGASASTWRQTLDAMDVGAEKATARSGSPVTEGVRGDDMGNPGADGGSQTRSNVKEWESGGGEFRDDLRTWGENRSCGANRGVEEMGVKRFHLGQIPGKNTITFGRTLAAEQTVWEEDVNGKINHESWGGLATI